MFIASCRTHAYYHIRLPQIVSNYCFSPKSFDTIALQMGW